MQDSKGDPDVKHRLLDYVGEGTGGMMWQSRSMYITMCEIDDQCKLDA